MRPTGPPMPGKPGNTLMAVLLIIGLTVLFGVAVVMTLMLVMSSSNQADLDPAGSSETSAPLAPAMPSEVTTDSPAEEDYEEERLPAGAAVPLSVSQKDRDELAAAARTAADGSGDPDRAGRIITSGTIYYGKVYGKTSETDSYYVVASLDSVYFWTLQGEGPWKYEGVFDARKCGPPVPLALTRAWGVGGMFGKPC